MLILSGLFPAAVDLRVEVEPLQEEQVEMSWALGEISLRFVAALIAELKMSKMCSCCGSTNDM